MQYTNKDHSEVITGIFLKIFYMKVLALKSFPEKCLNALLENIRDFRVLRFSRFNFGKIACGILKPPKGPPPFGNFQISPYAFIIYQNEYTIKYLLKAH